MVSKTLWAPESVAELLSTELNNLPDDTIAFDDADYPNQTNKYQFADFFFFADGFASTPASGAFIELHIFYKLNGTKYADGSDGTMGTPVTSGSTLHGIFQISNNNATDQYQQLLGVPILPYAFRVGILMATGQALTALDTHFVNMYPRNHEGQ